jgi:hypothetical protein
MKKKKCGSKSKGRKMRTAKVMNNVKLKSLKLLKDSLWRRFDIVSQKLAKNCHCPDSFMRTRVGYETDTLGSNGTSWYQDFCSVCGKQGKSYGGVYGNYSGGAKYKAEDKE